MARGIELLHPELQPLARQFETQCKASGLNVLITETWRSTAEQDALYVQGRTKPGSIVTNCKGSDYQSPHQWGVAFDFCRNEKGREYIDTDGFFVKCSAIAKKLGLFWGGDFKSFVDKPHVEYASKFLPNNSTTTLRQKYGVPEVFKRTWGTAAAPQALPTVRLGSSGQTVTILQTALNKLGYSCGSVDGIFGVKTDMAVKQFQKAKGQAADGIAGAKTWAALGL